MTPQSEAILVNLQYVLLVTRIWFGVNMVIHGYPKLRHLKKTANGMKQGLGIPVGATYAATTLELFGDIFLMIGLIVPIVGLFFAIFMVANILMKRKKMNADYISTDKPSYEVDITYLILSMILAVLGAGAFSVDSVIGIP